MRVAVIDELRHCVMASHASRWSTNTPLPPPPLLQLQLGYEHAAFVYPYSYNARRVRRASIVMHIAAGAAGAASGAAGACGMRALGRGGERANAFLH